MSVLPTISFRRICGPTLVLLALSLSYGCSKTPVPAPIPVSAPVPVADVPTTVKLISKSVDKLDQQLADADPRFSFLADDRHSEFIFVNIERGPLQINPGIFVVRKGRYEFFDLSDGRFDNLGWVKGYISQDRKHLWAITDSIVESPAWNFNIIHSADGGASWVVAASIHKPSYQAGVDSFRMQPDGSGELTLLYEDGGDVTNVPGGYYVYTTRDWGNSWSVPVHVPTVLSRPDSVPPELCPPEKTLSAYLKGSLRNTDADH